MLKGASLEYTKAHNHRIVLEYICLNGPISRAEIARQTNLTKQTISNIVSRLLEQNLICETGTKQGKVGSHSTQLEFNALGAYSIGLDVDQNHITGLIIDLDGIIHHRIKTELKLSSAEQAIDIMVDTSRRLIDKIQINKDRIIGVGVGFPEPIRITDGRLIALSAYELSRQSDHQSESLRWVDVSLVEQLSKRLELPIFLENNATAAAIGESFFGVAGNINNFLYVFLSEGIGGVIIHNKHPIHGLAGSTSELGFISSHQNQQQQLGAFFDLASLFKSLADGKKDNLTIQSLSDYLDDDNPILLNWLNQAATELAHVLISVEYFINPEAIIFGGLWPGKLIDVLLERLSYKMASLRLPKLTVSPAKYLRAKSGEEAAALWIATLAIYSLLLPDPTALQKRHDSVKDDLFVSPGKGQNN